MISLFRRIRQKLIASGSATKYMLYAIGEILLIVIGIIIAVQIGNWNQTIQNKELLRISLENLREDLVIQKEIIDEQILFESDMIAMTDTVLMLLQHPAPSPAEITPILYNLTSRRTFIANKATFNNLESTGNIVLIQDKELKNELIRYHQQLDYTAAVITNNNLFLIDNIFGAFVSSNGMGFRSNRDGSIIDDHTITSQQHFTITGQVRRRKAASESLLNISELQLTSTLELISLINNTLGNRPPTSGTNTHSDD